MHGWMLDVTKFKLLHFFFRGSDWLIRRVLVLFSRVMHDSIASVFYNCAVIFIAGFGMETIRVSQWLHIKLLGRFTRSKNSTKRTPYQALILLCGISYRNLIKRTAIREGGILLHGEC